jgi:hypothetical protein
MERLCLVQGGFPFHAFPTNDIFHANQKPGKKNYLLIFKSQGRLSHVTSPCISNKILFCQYLPFSQLPETGRNYG